MSSRPIRAWQVQSTVKVIPTVFFDCEGVIHHELLPCGQMVNKEYYLKVMKRGSEEKKA
jgi:hypothetical protein